VEPRRLQAAKVVAKDSITSTRQRQKLMSEIKIHRSLDHENICKFDHHFEDDINVYIVLEICTNHSLNDKVKRRKRLTEVEAQCYGMQILKSLDYMHRLKIVHRDMKLGNLFLSDKM